MPRQKLTTHDIALRVRKNLEKRYRLTKSDKMVLDLIQSKNINDFNADDLKALKNKDHKILEGERLEKLMEYLCIIGKSERSMIENDIIEYSGYEPPLIQDKERLKLSVKMLRNYNRNIPDDIKLAVHNKIKASLNTKNQNIKSKTRENHEKFFLGGMVISFLKSNNINDNYLDITLEMIKLYLMKSYFDKELLSSLDINEFNISEDGKDFSDKKNWILIDPNNPFKKS